MSVSLSEHLPLLASAPNGIKKLRGLILELAVRGKLVPQDPSDEPASELLKRIAAEKARLMTEGELKKEKLLPPLSGDEKPFELPIGWEWVRFGDICSYIQRGKGPEYVEHSDFPVISQKCVRWHGLDLSQARCIRPDSIPKYDEIRFLREGDILWNSTGTGTIGRAVVTPAIPQDAKWVVDSHVTIVRPLKIVSIFLWRWIQAPTVQDEIEGNASGSTNQIELNTSTVVSHLAPVPPLAEQHRIVAKVDELMALCDRMEAEQADAEAAHTTLVQTLLGTFTQSRDAAELAANWQRLNQHFDTLFTTEKSLDALKQTILQLAVMGKLVPQDPNDEPASELLKRIAVEKARLVAEGTCKKSKPMPPVGEDEQPFEVPGGWEWVRWNDVAQKIGDIDHKMPDTVKDGVPYVSPRDFYPDNRIDFEGAKRVSRDDFLRLSAKTRPEVDDIIYPRYGTIGENRLVVDDLEFLASYSCCVIKTLYGFVVPKFQFCFSISQCCRDQAKAAENKTTQANVGIKSIQEFALPLPPLPEQHRIVAKVDELMALCDSIKADLAESRTRQARLATTLIESALHTD